MKLTLNKWSALYLMRELRCDPARRNVLQKRSNMAIPDPSPLKRWGRTLFKTGPLERIARNSGKSIYVAIPDAASRLQSTYMVNTVLNNNIPEQSFIDVGDGIAISSPELLFVEMAALMQPIEHLMLGHELCGTFGRDAKDPRNGDAAYNLPPLTTVERIRAYLEETQGITGIAKARESLARLDGNAWSPTESLIAAFLRCPIDSFGFGFDSLTMNERVNQDRSLPGTRKSRVPDILIGDTNVGLNYDGLMHLNLNSIANAAYEMGAHPANHQPEIELKRAIESVRAKALDDIRRNRELLAHGYIVYPVLKEDLYQPRGFDQLVARILDTVELKGKSNFKTPRRALASRALCEDRYRLLRSLLPGTYEPEIQLGRYIEGHRVVEGAPAIIECWIEL